MTIEMCFYIFSFRSVCAFEINEFKLSLTKNHNQSFINLKLDLNDKLCSINFATSASYTLGKNSKDGK